MQDILLKSVRFLKGVGPNNAAKLAKLNLLNINDLLEHYPHRYEDRSKFTTINELEDGSFSSFSAVVSSVDSYKTRGPVITKVAVRDRTGIAQLVWFGQPGRKNAYKTGMNLYVYGRVKRVYGKIQVENPDVEIGEEGEYAAHSGKIIPVYPSSENISQNLLRSLIRQILEFNLELPDVIPKRIIKSLNLMSHQEAIGNIHFPENMEILAKARRTLVFEELFLLQCALGLLRKQNKLKFRGIKHSADGDLSKTAERNLPFKLTGDQQKVLSEIKDDMEDITPMQRLVQGDVGSGKTVLAALALIKTVENGFQGAMMAPTEILAEQHYHSLAKIMAPLGIKIGMLTGKLTKTAREEVISHLKEGILDIAIGTHALIQDSVQFQNLALVVTDEQHRFGVRQRAKLQEKGEMPDVLVMTATPIPRTMALTIYGDLDVSAVHQLPPGRKPIKTYARGADRRELVYKFVLDEIAKGRQAYIVCPLVEESEKIEAQSASGLFEELTAGYFQEVSCGLVHGKLKATEKDKVMSAFYNGELQILVATTVIEVGVNVPNATIIVIEGADRFGLAQLHQLRGRVGRGEHQSYCILIYDGKTSQIPERLKIMTEVSDGFELAEKDLLLRGPGQFFGTRQHGIPDLKIADILNDIDVLLEARKAANTVIGDNALVQEMLPAIREKFHDKFGGILCS